MPVLLNRMCSCGIYFSAPSSHTVTAHEGKVNYINTTKTQILGNDGLRIAILFTKLKKHT
jgi:hypothetical protein